MPDVALDVGTEPSETAATSHIPRAERPPVVLEMPNSSPEPSELRRCPDTPGKWFRPPARATRGRGPALLLLHTVLESVPLPLADGVSNGTPLV